MEPGTLYASFRTRTKLKLLFKKIGIQDETGTSNIL